MHRFFLIPWKLKGLAHSDDKQGYKEGTPKGCYNDDWPTDIRIGHQISKTDRCNGHNDNPDRLEVAIEIYLTYLPVILDLKYPEEIG